MALDLHDCPDLIFVSSYKFHFCYADLFCTLKVVVLATSAMLLCLQVRTELKNENQRLKDENGALIRVISKLSK